MANAQNHLKIKITLLALLHFLLLGGFLAPKLGAQQSLPLLQKTDLEYLGAFRLPRDSSANPGSFSFGGTPIAYNGANQSLFVGTKEGLVGEVKIPPPVKSSDIEKLPFATLLQNISDPLEGGRSVLPESNLRGLLVNGGVLYGTAMIYYDASNSARVSHFSRSTNLTEKSATSLKALWQPEKSGYVAGWLAAIPGEWQHILGGSILSGNCCVPIVSRTSFGPSAFAWNPRNFDKDPIPATPLLYYTEPHATLGPWGGANAVYGGTTMIGGMIIPNDTRSLLYFGSNGTGTFCYGTGGTEGECFDPLSSSKGQHAYPYNHQVWAYDLNDLAAVKAGTKQPWEVKPYATWNVDDFPLVSVYGISGVTYDAKNQIIYLSQARGDQDGYSARPLIHAYKVKIAEMKPPKTPVHKLPENTQTGVSTIEYNNGNDQTLGSEEKEIGGESQSNPHLDNRDAPRGWLGAYRRALGYVGHLYRTLLSYFTA